jgi:hypothetical protein
MQFNLFNENLSILVSKFLATVKKGETFELPNGDSIQITNVKKNKLINESISILYKGKKGILKFVGGSYHSNLKSRAKGFNLGYNLYRDIEGLLIIDSINKLNPFHEKSSILKHLEKNITV